MMKYSLSGHKKNMYFQTEHSEYKLTCIKFGIVIKLSQTLSIISQMEYIRNTLTARVCG